MRGKLRDLHGLGEYFNGLAPSKYKLIILDAFYRFLPEGTDENDNGSIAHLYNLLDRHADRIGCAFVLIHHTSKGLQSGKAVTDVGAGAGAQSRATDTHVVLRHHKLPRVVVLDAAVRSWQPVEPICLRWNFPIWNAEPDLDPEELEGAKKSKRHNNDPNHEKMSFENFYEQFITDAHQTTEEVTAKAKEAGLSRRQVQSHLDYGLSRNLIYRFRDHASKPYQLTRQKPPPEE